MPGNNTRWIIGTTITVAIALSAQMAIMISGLRDETNRRFDQIDQRFNQVEQRSNQRFNRIEQRLDGFDERLRAVEISFAKVDQRLLILERTLIPAPPGAPN